MEDQSIEIESIKQEGETVPAITKLMLAPTPEVFAECSPYTQGHMSTLAKILLFTVTICGVILGASISHFGFQGKAIAYICAIPIGILLYYFLDRLVVMSDNRENAGIIKKSRIVIAFVFGLFNSFLIDSFWYRQDIIAAQQQEIVAAQSALQFHADSLAANHRAHKDILYGQIKASAQELKGRNTDLVTEAEGSSATHHIGRGPAYFAKLEAYQRDSAANAHTASLIMAEAAKEDSVIADIEHDAATKKVHVPLEVSGGINHQMELLHHAIMRSPVTMLVAFLCLIIAMILELLPLLAKHYLDITEYFLHADHHKEKHLANGELKTSQAIELEQHILTHAHEQARNEADGAHAIASAHHRMGHREELLAEADNHLGNVIAKEADMQERFPDHFEQHASPLFTDMYDQLRRQYTDIHTTAE